MQKGWTDADTERPLVAWVRLATALAFGVIAGLWQSVVGVYSFVVYERDPDVSHPLVSAAVPLWLLLFLAWLIPLAGIVFVHWYLRAHMVRRWWTTLSYFFLVIMAVNLVTEVVKVHCGRPRPNFFAMCDYKGYAAAVNSGNYTAYFAQTVPGRPIDRAFCSQQEWVAEASMSFPSGHSSNSFGGLTFLGGFLYLVLREMNVAMNGVRALLFRGVRLTLPCVCLSIATWVATSRLRDYFHHADDIAVGSIIGFAFAIIGLIGYAKAFDKTSRAAYQAQSEQTEPIVDTSFA